MSDFVLWVILGVCVCAIALSFFGQGTTSQGQGSSHQTESFADFDLQRITSEALDRSPSTSEVKDDYKRLLIYANSAIRSGGDEAVKALKILADLRDRLFDVHDFRDNLIVSDFIDNWPTWIPPIDPTITEPEYTCADGSTSEQHILAYLQKNFPREEVITKEEKEKGKDKGDQNQSTVRNIIEDFGYRFVFKKGEETVELSKNFLRKPLLRGWTSSCFEKTNSL